MQLHHMSPAYSPTPSKLYLTCPRVDLVATTPLTLVILNCQAHVAGTSQTRYTYPSTKLLMLSKHFVGTVQKRCRCPPNKPRLSTKCCREPPKTLTNYQNMRKLQKFSRGATWEALQAPSQTFPGTSPRIGR